MSPTSLAFNHQWWLVTPDAISASCKHANMQWCHQRLLVAHIWDFTYLSFVSTSDITVSDFCWYIDILINWYTDILIYWYILIDIDIKSLILNQIYLLSVWCYQIQYLDPQSEWDSSTQHLVNWNPTAWLGVAAAKTVRNTDVIQQWLSVRWSR